MVACRMKNHCSIYLAGIMFLLGFFCFFWVNSGWFFLFLTRVSFKKQSNQWATVACLTRLILLSCMILLFIFAFQFLEKFYLERRKINIKKINKSSLNFMLLNIQPFLSKVYFALDCFFSPRRFWWRYLISQS